MSEPLIDFRYRPYTWIAQQILLLGLVPGCASLFLYTIMRIINKNGSDKAAGKTLSVGLVTSGVFFYVTAHIYLSRLLLRRRNFKWLLKTLDSRELTSFHDFSKGSNRSRVLVVSCTADRGYMLVKLAKHLKAFDEVWGMDIDWRTFLRTGSFGDQLNFGHVERNIEFECVHRSRIGAFFGYAENLRHCLSVARETESRVPFVFDAILFPVRWDVNESGFPNSGWKSIDECLRLLRPGGSLILPVAGQQKGLVRRGLKYRMNIRPEYVSFSKNFFVHFAVVKKPQDWNSPIAAQLEKYLKKDDFLEKMVILAADSPHSWGFLRIILVVLMFFFFLGYFFLLVYFLDSLSWPSFMVPSERIGSTLLTGLPFAFLGVAQLHIAMQNSSRIGDDEDPLDAGLQRRLFFRLISMACSYLAIGFVLENLIALVLWLPLLMIAFFFNKVIDGHWPVLESISMNFTEYGFPPLLTMCVGKIFQWIGDVLRSVRLARVAKLDLNRGEPFQINL